MSLFTASVVARLRIAFLLLPAVVVACGTAPNSAGTAGVSNDSAGSTGDAISDSHGTTSTAGSVTVDTIQAQFLGAFCASDAQCPEAQRLFSSKAACLKYGGKQHVKARSVDGGRFGSDVAHVKAGKATFDAEQAVKCVSAISAGCITDILPLECSLVFKGVAAVGAACEYGGECNSGKCTNAFGGCGKCESSAIGDTCEPGLGDCVWPAECAGGKCVAMGSGNVGDACEVVSATCAKGLTCRGVCALPGKEGELCAAGIYGCAGGLFCTGFNAGPGLCIAVQGKEGGKCVVFPVSAQKYANSCADGLRCVGFTCEAAVDVDAPCKDTKQCKFVDLICAGDGGKKTCRPLGENGQACAPSQSAVFDTSCVAPYICESSKMVCVELPKAGEACIDGRCVATSTCTSANKCVAHAKVGEACQDYGDCGSDLTCGQDKKCTATGILGKPCNFVGVCDYPLACGPGSICVLPTCTP